MCFLTDANPFSWPNLATFDIVQTADLINGNSVSAGDASQGISFADGVILCSLCILGTASVTYGYGSSFGQVLFGIVSIDAVLTLNESVYRVVGQA